MSRCYYVGWSLVYEPESIRFLILILRAVKLVPAEIENVQNEYTKKEK